MKNYGDLGGCYPPRPTASTDNTLLGLRNSSYNTQPHSLIVNKHPLTTNAKKKRFRRVPCIHDFHQCKKKALGDILASRFILKYSKHREAVRFLKFMSLCLPDS